MNKLGNRSSGLDQARSVLTSKKYSDFRPVKPTLFVGAFGIVEPTGYKNVISFVVHDRKDRRYGVVNAPAPKDAYCESLFEEMFKNW
jgi:hypothetical protein